MVYQRAVLLFAFCFILSACSKPTLNTIAHDGSILAFGDSLTYGTGVSAEHSYPAVLARLTQRQVINAGVAGETTEQGLHRLRDLLADDHYDLLILLEGGNDILRNQDLQQTKANLAAMIALAQSNDIPVLLIAVPEKQLFSKAAPFYKELAEQYQIPLMPHLISDLLKQAAMKSDAIHFNQQGYQAMAEAIEKKLRQLKAL